MQTIDDSILMMEIKHAISINDWEKIYSIIIKKDSNGNMSIILPNNFSVEVVESLSFSLGLFIKQCLKEYDDFYKKTSFALNNKNVEKLKINTLNNCLKKIIESYFFVMKSKEDFPNSIRILQSVAYINRAFFFDLNSRIKKIISREDFLLPRYKKFVNKYFNNATSCLLALKYYKILEDIEIHNVKSLYRYATTIMKISNFSIKQEKQEEIFSKTKDLIWAKDYYKRFINAKRLLLKAIQFYESDALNKKEKEQCFKEYIKSKINLVKLINEYYDCQFSVNDVFKIVSMNEGYTEVKTKNLLKLQNELILMYNTMNEVLDKLNLSKEKLNEAEILRLANIENDKVAEKSFNVYYRSGRVWELLAKCALSQLPTIRERSFEKSMKKFIDNMIKAINMYQNVANIKLQRKKMKKKDTGGFIYEIKRLGFCYSLLGIQDAKYTVEFNNLVDKYKNKKGKSFQQINGTFKYYKALTYIYNKDNRNAKKALLLLEEVKKDIIKIDKNLAGKAQNLINCLKNGEI